MDSKLEKDLRKIQASLKEILEVGEIPPFEVNEETVPILLQIIANHEERKEQIAIISRQMSQETEELVADRTRMNKVLAALDLDPLQGISPKARKLVKTLVQGMDALEVASASLPILVVAITELLDDVNKSSIEIETLEDNCRVLSEDFKEAKDLLVLLQRQNLELESQLVGEQKNVESLQKSGKFHRQKKKQYDGAIAESERRLREANYQPQLSHSEISKLGGKANELNEKLKPLLLQLSSYKQLPPDANLARLKLCEVMDELKGVEAELHEVFQNMNLSK